MFQSRNRETYDSNDNSAIQESTHFLLMFQSRNRETYDSNNSPWSRMDGNYTVSIS